jgi:hypothetical protein
MNKLSTTRKASNGDSDRNQLNAIRGLGSAKKQWLSVAGIHTIQELAQVSAKELANQLKDMGYGVSLGEVAGWIAQAQESQIEGWIAESQELAPVSEPAPEPEVIDDSIPMTRDWQAIASFSVESHNSFAVEFQTRQVDGVMEQRTIVLHRETKKREVWPSIDQERLQRWILSQVKANLHQEAAILETCVTDGPIAVEINQLQFFQTDRIGLPMIADRSKPLLPDALLAEKPFDLKLSIQLPERAIAELSNQLIVLHVSGQARHLATGEVIQLGETRMNGIGGANSIFTLWLRDMMLHHTGGYRLRLSATIENLPATPALFKVPVLELASANPPACLIG